jgi:MioC protein
MKIVILYGTQTGTAESLANQLQDELAKNTNHDVQCENLSEFNYEDEFLDSEKHSLYLFILATSEGGSAPEGLTDFYDWLIDANEIKCSKYSIFGVGNSQYKETYQKVSRDIKEKMNQIAGDPCIECVEGDASDTLDDDFARWTSIIKLFLQ